MVYNSYTIAFIVFVKMLNFVLTNEMVLRGPLHLCAFVLIDVVIYTNPLLKIGFFYFLLLPYTIKLLCKINKSVGDYLVTLHTKM